MSEAILELKNIKKSFSGVEVLHGVDFCLQSGEIHAILGENGAGKSTLIKIVTGFHKPDSGEILLKGEPVAFDDTHDSRQAGIAAIYQELSLFPDLDVAENIFIGRQPVTKSGMIDWSRLYTEAERLLESLSVDLDLRQKTRNMSIAQKQMVEIARAFSINAQILIMDEPTSSLTLNEVADLFKLVRRLRDNGTAVIFISHRLDELFELADRVTILRDGCYIDTCDVGHVTKDVLIQKMVGRTISNQYPKLEVEPGEAMMKVEHLTREGAFYDISFELRRGEILGVAGLVGAGRTDVADTLFGVTPATSGQISIQGHEVQISSPQVAIDLGIAYVPEDRQKHGLISDMNILSNVSLPTLPKHSDHGWLNNKREREASYEAAVQMEIRARDLWQLARELSGGNQQKVVLAKWLLTNPKILILDEPTRGIDVGTKAAVHALMSQLVAEGMTILMISSELPEILGMSDRVIVMREGHLTGHFTREEATQEKILTVATENIQTGIA